MLMGRRKVRESRDEVETLAFARKVPWKLVGDFIHKNGGSYHFGAATIRKKWDQLRAARKR